MSIKHVILGNERFKVEIATPITACMAEYGPRFDTLGAVTGIACGEQSFCAREGLIDEFNIQPPLSPPGYDEARPGETFVKIGVGELIRADEQSYRFSHPYAIRQLAPVTQEKTTTAVTLCQNLCVDAGWGYEYRKTYRVQTGTATLAIEYALKNTGQRLILAEHYNHNWFKFGREPVNESYVLETRFAVEEKESEWLAHERGCLAPTGPITRARYFPSAQASPAQANWMRLSHPKRGWSIVVSGDSDVARFALYADTTAFCPEVFSVIRVAPGEVRCWTRHYQFLNDRAS